MNHSRCPIEMSRVSLAISASSLALAQVLWSVMECVRVVRHGAHFSRREPLNTTQQSFGRLS